MNNKLAAWSLALTLLTTAAHAADPRPEEVVLAFNQAITARKLDAALALLAKGSVQYTLRAAHAGVTTDATSITSDLTNHWRTIGPVLFGVTQRYERVASIEQTRVDGDLATVWAMVTSRTVERNGKQRDDKFTEVYLLVRAKDAWQIAGMADNRGTDKLTIDRPRTP
ncbi:MAG TPA: hypothetical protein PK159_17520 [Steroidobacteraceae bacterium]|nr:hypothetical protein [Steroidobacteraceae bacterium]